MPNGDNRTRRIFISRGAFSDAARDFGGLWRIFLAIVFILILFLPPDFYLGFVNMLLALIASLVQVIVSALLWLVNGGIFIILTAINLGVSGIGNFIVAIINAISSGIELLVNAFIGGINAFVSVIEGFINTVINPACQFPIPIGCVSFPVLQPIDLGSFGPISDLINIPDFQIDDSFIPLLKFPILSLSNEPLIIIILNALT